VELVGNASTRPRGDWARRLLDLRPGERRMATTAFLVLLFIVMAQTVLETARDALVVIHVPLNEVGVVYIAVALFAIPAASLTAFVSQRYGARYALSAALAVMMLATLAVTALPKDRGSAIVLYVVSGVTGALLPPQFWLVLGAELTVEQGRRLLGMIGIAGICGAIAGSATAATLVTRRSVDVLLLLAASALLCAFGVLFSSRSHLPARDAVDRRPAAHGLAAAFREEPLLFRVALAVTLTTAAVLSIDYFFKWTVIRAVSPDARVPFVARFYAAQNAASLLVQLCLGRFILRRYGVASATVVTPLLISMGAIGALLTGGAALAVFVVKGVDGSLRNSVHRVTTELVYLPVPLVLRQRVKPFIDGALMRAAQGLTAALLLLLGARGWLSSTLFAGLTVGLALAWTATAFSLRRPYVGVLRRSISMNAPVAWPKTDTDDLESARGLVERLASDDELEVLATLNALYRRGAEHAISALILLHEDEHVVARALEIFALSSRTDWYTLARRKLKGPHQRVRLAAVRALARHETLDPNWLGEIDSSEVRGYLSLHYALREIEHDLAQDERIRSILATEGVAAARERTGLLSALADLRPDPRALPLILLLHRRSDEDPERFALLTEAAGRHGQTAMIPELVSALTHRSRERAARAALVQLGQPALDALTAVLLDRTRDRILRARVPDAIALFGTSEAGAQLLHRVERESDGLLRYRAIRALGRLVGESRVRIERKAAERLAQRDLREYFRLLALKLEFQAHVTRADAKRPSDPTAQLVMGLLADKQKQSLERAFRLLKIANPDEDIHRVHRAVLSNQRETRANAGAFLDALFWRRDQRLLRSLLRIVADDLPANERVMRATAYLGTFERPRSASDDRDPVVQALSAVIAGNAITYDPTVYAAGAQPSP
jgi:AAA family ATP:ADP antiporter